LKEGGGGKGNGTGIRLLGSNVTIKNVEIKAFFVGMRLFASNNSIVGNTVTNNGGGILLNSSNYNSIVGNNITASDDFGIWLLDCSNNSVVGNNITNNLVGIEFWAFYNSIIGNNITGNMVGIGLVFSSNYNSIVRNNITASWMYGIHISFQSPNNKIYHNNFVNNQVQVWSDNSANFWDNGYPAGGNFWSDYSDVDLYRGALQNEVGSDGIWDHPYTINSNNKDRYPLAEIYPWLGDFDDDGDVDYTDIVYFATAYISYWSGQGKDPLCDFDKDGDIDYDDILTFVSAYIDYWTP